MKWRAPEPTLSVNVSAAGNHEDWLGRFAQRHLE